MDRWRAWKGCRPRSASCRSSTDPARTTRAAGGRALSPDTRPPGDPVDVTNEAIKTLGKVAVTFLVTIVYLGITAASTTHAQLLRGRDLTLPLLDVEVPVFEFFRVAAAMTVVLHVVFLLQVYFVYQRLRNDAVKNRRDLVMPSIFSEGALPAAKGQGLVVAAVRFSVLLILIVPLGLLALIQTKFLPYHEPSITRWWHQGPALVGFFLSIWLIPKILSPTGVWWGFWTQRLASRTYFVVSRLLVVLSCVGFLFFSCRVAAVPDAQPAEDELGAVPARGFPRRHLKVSGQRLVDTESWRPPPPGLPGFASLDLSDRDLWGGDFSHAILHGVDFRGADLRRASFAGADLRGADFSSGAGNGRDRSVVTDLAGANLAGAYLEGALLDRARLVGADLSDADLRYARLDGADLRRADLSGARLDGASLRYARLTGANLEGTVLDCADLYAADGEGLRAAEVRAVRADLRRARLSGSTFVGAELWGADFSDAIAIGGDFRGVDLRSTRGLSLIQMDLRRASLSGATVSGSPVRAPRLVDGRAIVLEGAGDTNEPPRCPSRSAAAASSPPPRDDRAVAEVLEMYSKRNLLDAPLRGTGGTSERQFFGEVVESLLGPATGSELPAGCRSSALAAVLVLRAVGCALPRDPVLEEQLLPRVRALAADPADCPAFAPHAAELRRRLPEPDEEVDRAWPPDDPEVLHWDFAEVDCSALREELWELATE